MKTITPTDLGRILTCWKSELVPVALHTHDATRRHLRKTWIFANFHQTLIDRFRRNLAHLAVCGVCDVSQERGAQFLYVSRHFKTVFLFFPPQYSNFKAVVLPFAASEEERTHFIMSGLVTFTLILKSEGELYNMLFIDCIVARRTGRTGK